MIVTKKSIARRTFLRGAGVAVALPFLDAMVPALSRAEALTRTRRLGFWYIPNGAIMDRWTPPVVGTDFEMTPILSALTPFRDKLTILTGLGQNNAYNFGDGNGDHSRATPTWLSGMRPKRTEGADVQAGTTADQIAAKEFARQTQIASLELGVDANYLVGNCENGYSCVYMNTVSWRNPTTPNPVENNPRAIFERMFGDGGSAEQRLAQMRTDRSILDSAAVEIASLRNTLGPRDRSRVDEYTDAVREMERRIQRAEEQSAKITVPVPERPAGIPENYEEHLNLMFDLQILAWQGDITRVITFMMGRELSQRTYPMVGVTDAHHNLTHHLGDKAKIEKVAKINTYHIGKFAAFLERLRRTPDGDGSLFDNSMILYGGGISDGNLHDHSPLPALLLGGGSGQLKGGRHLKYPDHTPMSNLLVAMLDKAGLKIDHLGDSTGELSLEPLAGV